MAAAAASGMQTAIVVECKSEKTQIASQAGH
jgi:hypothetical protein